MSRRSIRGVEAISAALDASHSLSLLLIRDRGASDAAEALASRAASRGIAVRRESARELRRMGARDARVEVLALEGPAPATTLEELMRAEAVVFLLAGLRYPGNVGFVLRCVEVAGGAGVVLDHDWAADQRADALRFGMRADRFLPVLDASARDAVAAAREAGRRIIALETGGRAAPWECDLTSPLLAVVGSETTGIDTELLEDVDEIVTIPTAGFIPSYNVQAAVGILLGEWLRQTTAGGRAEAITNPSAR